MVPQGRGPGWVSGLLCDPGHVASPLWACSQLWEMRGWKELIFEVPFSLKHLMFYEIHMNVTMETSERNCSSTEFDFHPKEKRTQSCQKAAGVRGALLHPPPCPSAVLPFDELRPCQAGGQL